MIIHSPIISGSLTFASGATFVLPANGQYTGSFSGSVSGIGDTAQFSASLNSKIESLKTDTGSQDARLDSIESFTSSIDTTIKNKLNTETVVSGSGQVINLLPSGVISGSSQVVNLTNGQLQNNSITIAGTATALGSSITLATITGNSGIVSGSSQLTTDFDSRYLNTNGDLVVSGSSQIDATATTNFATGIKTQLNSNTVVSGSSQVDADSITNFDTNVKDKLNADGVVSGSAQVVGILSSLNTYTASNDTTNNTQNSRLDLLSTASGSAIGRLNNLESYTSSLKTAITVAGSDVTVNGNLTISGTTTTINSTTVAIGDNIIQLNGTGGTNGGIVVRDATEATTTSGSLLWDTTNDKWIAGPLGSEDDVVLRTLSQTLTNKTISGASNTLSNIANASLTNSSITVTAGTGMSGGGTVSLGSSTTLTNAGVTSNVAGTGISVSGATGDVTITNSGVTSNVAGTGVSVSGATGAVTISIGQAVATSSNVQFNSLGVGMAASATAGRIDATNDIVAYSSSDIRFKENIKPIENAIDKIKKISGNTYDWKEENKIEHGYEGNDVGVIAQEIEAVLPQLVQTRESGYKAVKYDKLVALLIEGIKEQQLQIEQLRIDLDNCRNNK